MKLVSCCVSCVIVATLPLVSAWAPNVHQKHSSPLVKSVPSSVPSQPQQPSFFDPFQLETTQDTKIESSWKPPAIILSGAALVASPAIASAATAGAPNAVGSALAAYGHYFSLLGLLGCLMIERLTIKPNMNEEEENLVTIADIVYGVFGVLIVYTGYLRLSQFEKGWDFYSHEPLFWLKMLFLGIFGASSFFNTSIIIQRSLAKRNGTLEPMGERLAARMIQICNAELTALAVMPLAATFMARGIAYSDAIPWQAEAAVTGLVTAGLSYKYIKESLSFQDGPKTE